jgi:hypothetical protein
MHDLCCRAAEAFELQRAREPEIRGDSQASEYRNAKMADALDVREKPVAARILPV